MYNVCIFTDIEMPFTGREKAFCVLEYARSQTYKTEQHAFVREFTKQSSTEIQIWAWHKKFREEGCLCRRKGSGRAKTSEETVERVHKFLGQSPKKLLRRTSLETHIPPTTVRRTLMKCLLMKPYKLQLVLAITAEDNRKHKPN